MKQLCLPLHWYLTKSEKEIYRKEYNIFSKRVSMGLTDRRKTTKNLVDSRKNWKILTVRRK